MEASSERVQGRRPALIGRTYRLQAVVPQELAEALAEMGRRESRSLSGMAAWILQRHVEQHRQENGDGGEAPPMAPRPAATEVRGARVEAARRVSSGQA